MSVWKLVSKAPRDGSEFQGWVVDGEGGFWEPRCRINPETEAQELWGRVDYDQDGWDVYPHLSITHWMPQPLGPISKARSQPIPEGGEK